MTKLYRTAVLYLILGLAAGVFYREYTKIVGFPSGEYTQLSTLHTHLLALGFMVMLIVLLLDRAFGLSGRKSFSVFFWTYNAGLLLTSAMMTVHGLISISGGERTPATAGIAGLGHIAIAGGLTALLIALGKGVREAQSAREQSALAD